MDPVLGQAIATWTRMVYLEDRSTSTFKVTGPMITMVTPLVVKTIVTSSTSR